MDYQSVSVRIVRTKNEPRNNEVQRTAAAQMERRR